MCISAQSRVDQETHFFAESAKNMTQDANFRRKLKTLCMQYGIKPRGIIAATISGTVTKGYERPYERTRGQRHASQAKVRAAGHG